MIENECLLDYSIHTIPHPMKSSPKTGDRFIAKMIITVSNSNEFLIKCRKIHLQLKIGEYAQNLTDIGDSIRPSVFPSGKWEVAYDGGGQFIFTPRRHTDKLITTDALTFCLDHIYVNKEPGTFRLNVIEYTKKDVWNYYRRTATFTWTKFPHYLIENR
ncbi:hypothetical protein P4V58_11550 [Bacillus wiedmannii]|uniref:hypothetical protein n=1 Tax=Bacillus wiedmannii TaxID=1890302 RepID=UPI002E223A6A|nr:hypothetical protein [Bacillus wiedmannii]